MNDACLIDCLFARKPQDSLISIWTKQDRRSYWAESVDEAVNLANTLSLARRDVYFGVGLADDSARNRPGRLSAGEVVAITCMWIDIDIGIDGHSSGKRYPPDMESIGQILVAGGIPPSAIVHSGHGVHAYWLLDKPWVFADDSDRECAATLVKGFQDHLRQCARTLGYDIDSTHDLARLLRIPGTTNFKDPGNPAHVRLLEINPDRRHTVSQFKEVVMTNVTPSIPPADAAPAANEQTTSQAAQRMDLKLDASIQVPLTRLAELTSNDERFLQTWQHERQDLKSDSEYDQAIAVAALRRGWSEQETLNLLVMHRRERTAVSGKTDDKLQRLDYFEKTIRSAADFIADHDLQSMEEIEQQVLAIMEAVHGGNKYADKAQREILRHYLSRVLGVEIHNMVQYGRETPSYVLKVGGGVEIEFTKPDDLLSKSRFLNRLAGAVNWAPEIDAETWSKLRNVLVKAFEVDRDGIGGKLQGFADWVADYVTSVDISDDLRDAIDSRDLFRDQSGKLYLYKANFVRWVMERRARKISDSEADVGLKRLGFVNVEKQQRPIKKCLWLLPPAYVSAATSSSPAAA